MNLSAVRNCCFLLFFLLSLTIFTGTGQAQVALYGMFSGGHYSGIGVGYGHAAQPERRA